MGSLPDQCCNLPPFKSDYTPIGRRVKIPVEGQNDLEVYVTGPETSKFGLVAIYDIFALHTNTMQGADYLGQKCGYKIAMPDFFRGKAWDPDNIPPREGRPFLNAWIQEVGSYELVRPGLFATIEWLKSQGCEDLSSYGVCFGAKKLVQGAHELPFKAMALPHPSFFQAEDAENVHVPVALMPSQGEDKDAMNGFWERIQQKPFADKCIREDFLDLHHGYCSARANWNDAQQAKRSREAYDLMAKFFKETF